MRWLLLIALCACGSKKSDADKAEGLVRDILKQHQVPATPKCPAGGYAVGQTLQCTATDPLGQTLAFDIVVESDKFRGSFAGAIVDTSTVLAEARRLVEDPSVTISYAPPTLLVPKGQTATIAVSNGKKVNVVEKDPARHTIEVTLGP